MVKYCSVPNCRNSTVNSDFSFHQFPSNEILLYQWRQAIGQHVPIKKFSVICSVHFEEGCLKFVGTRKCLIPNSVPSRYLGESSQIIINVDADPLSLDNHDQYHQTCLEVIDEMRKQLQDQLTQWESFMTLSPLDLIMKGTAQINTMKALTYKLETVAPTYTISNTSNENSPEQQLEYSSMVTNPSTAEKRLLSNNDQCHQSCLEVGTEIKLQLQDQLSRWESFMTLSPLDLIVKGTSQINTMKDLIEKLETVIFTCTSSEKGKENFSDELTVQNNARLRSISSTHEVEKLIADAAQSHFQTLFNKITARNGLI